MRGSDDDLTPEDMARLARWRAAGCPPVPLLVDRGDVQAITTSLATVLGHRAPAWAPFRHAAAHWVDDHCRA